MTPHLKSLLPKLSGQRVLVVGDVILDRYIFGNATRMSREAPVPVLEFAAQKHIPGGAANPAANITALGSQALQIGIVGDDADGAILRDVLQERAIETTTLITASGRPTTVKTRIMAQMGLHFPQQLARIDTLSREPINGAIETRLLEQVERHAPTASAILFSDYHIGLLTPTLIHRIREIARPHKLLLTADTQGKLDLYSGFDVIKCNANDAQAYLRRDIQGDEAFAQAARDLYTMLQLSGAMVITRGADGATMVTQDDTHHIPSPEVSDVYDTVGAGDTFIAVFTLAAIARFAYEQAVMLANIASGIVVRHVGNYTPSMDELAEAMTN